MKSRNYLQFLTHIFWLILPRKLQLNLLYHKAKKSFPATPSNTRSTLAALVNHRASLCRFGDGEFDIMLMIDKEKDKYQKGSHELSRRLIQILATPSENRLLVAIPPITPEIFHLDKRIKSLPFWKWYYASRFNLIEPYLTANYYFNAMVSRYPVFFENELSEIKKIWEGRDVLFIYGKGSRFSMDPRLFSNVSSVSVEYCLPTNAFDEYDDLLQRASTYAKHYLVLISAGPTATVLAYDLHHLGFQAIDLGHLPASYQQYMGEIASPERLPMEIK